jgi:hypothetical protein
MEDKQMAVGRTTPNSIVVTLRHFLTKFRYKLPAESGLPTSYLMKTLLPILLPLMWL